MTAATVARRVATSPLGAGRLARLRYLLTEQRRFRLDQLAELDRTEAPDAADPAAREVARSLAVGGRAALADVCEALRQIDSGRYGWCRDCHAPLPVDRLDLLPHVTRCSPCLEIRA